MEEPILYGHGYTCTICNKWNRTSALCDHTQFIESVKPIKDSWNKEEVKSLIWDCLHKLDASFDREKLTKWVKDNL